MVCKSEVMMRLVPYVGRPKHKPREGLSGNSGAKSGLDTEEFESQR
jgi:hypothetical protein